MISVDQTATISKRSLLQSFRSVGHRTLFKISLLFKSGSRKGDRISIQSSPCTFGRDDSCDQTLSSRSVSRRHCAIVANDHEVLIRDLGSRNGTFVDGEKIDPAMPRRLKHHSRIQIGKYRFRLSVRDAVTKEPFDPDSVQESASATEDYVIEPTHQTKNLLSELDRLAAQMDIEDFSPADESDSTEIPVSEAESSSDALPNDKGSEADDSTQFIVPQPESSKPESQAASTKSSESENEPMKLPKHLRPKQAENSQNAAADALKNLFIR